jgi:hypothetical protein
MRERYALDDSTLRGLPPHLMSNCATQHVELRAGGLG